MSHYKIASRAPRLLAAVFTTVALLTNIHAATINVTNTADDGDGSLRAALAAAALDPNIDPIDATGLSGTITLTSGELVVDSSVAILGPGAASLTVDGNQLSHVFRIEDGHTVTLDGMTIANGLAVGSYPYNAGGGIHTDHSDLTVINCTFSGNSAPFGGGIYARVLTVANCTFSGNSASLYGGGIYAGVLTVADCTFSSNSAYYDGGGIYNYGGNWTVANSTFSSNSASSGGGICNRGGGTLAVTNSTFSGNSAEYSGGGIYNEYYTSDLTVSNCTFSGNSTPFSGGGIFNVGQLKIGSTILQTSSIYNYASSDSTITSAGFNLSSDDGGGFLTATSDQINTDPKLGPLTDNGGPTLTHLPQPGSPAIDQGSSAGLVSLGITTDQRGLARVDDDPLIYNATGGDGTDIGAVELAPEDLPPAEQVDLLADAVDELISLGAILPANGNSLKAKLNTAFAALPDNPATAISSLQSFINQVTSFIKTGRLTAAEGQALIDAAQDIIDQLSI